MVIGCTFDDFAYTGIAGCLDCIEKGFVAIDFCAAVGRCTFGAVVAHAAFLVHAGMIARFALKHAACSLDAFCVAGVGNSLAVFFTAARRGRTGRIGIGDT